ncbi:unnamed protein product [Choristocarpus tenellus]
MMLGVGVVLLSVAVLTGFTTATIVTTLVLSTAIGTVGLVWAWGEVSSSPSKVSINAVSVCNLVMALGLSVEFCLHIATAFERKAGSRQERAAAAMKDTGSSVLTGITLTKLVGVSVLCIAPSLLFRLYYFRMYICVIIAGGFQGLAVLPVLLSLYGPQTVPLGSWRHLGLFSSCASSQLRDFRKGHDLVHQWDLPAGSFDGHSQQHHHRHGLCLSDDESHPGSGANNL